MKIQDYYRDYKIDESVQEIMQTEFYTVHFITLDKIPTEMWGKIKRRIDEEETKVALEIFHEQALGREGELVEVEVGERGFPAYIDRTSYGKRFLLKYKGTKLTGSYYNK